MCSSSRNRAKSDVIEHETDELAWLQALRSRCLQVTCDSKKGLILKICDLAPVKSAIRDVRKQSLSTPSSSTLAEV
jgi:hypothetical protein